MAISGQTATLSRSWCRSLVAAATISASGATCSSSTWPSFLVVEAMRPALGHGARTDQTPSWASGLPDFRASEGLERHELWDRAQTSAVRAYQQTAARPSAGPAPRAFVVVVNGATPRCWPAR